MLQAVGSIIDDLRDDEEALPWGGELVHLLLLQEKDKVPNHEGPGTQSMAVVVVKVLRVGSCTGKGNVVGFL